MIAIFERSDGVYEPRDENGLVRQYILPSEVKEIIKGLQKYCKQYSDDEIEFINWKNRKAFEDNMQAPAKKLIKKPRPGYIYILSCKDKYKIGYSKDVERRVKELDSRPFKIKLIAKFYRENAFAIERKLHEILDYKIADGEWYENFDMSLKEFEQLIDEIEEDLQ